MEGRATLGAPAWYKPAREGSPTNARAKERDWYSVSVETVRAVTIVILAIVLGGVGFLVWRGWQERALERRASDLINQVRALLQQVQSEEGAAAFEREIQSGWSSLELARTRHEEGELSGAIDAASVGRSTLLGVLDGLRDAPGGGEAQFLAIQGGVEFRRGERGEWREGRARVVLEPGDYVKTAGDGSAEIMFLDGTLYTVRPNTLLLISQTRGPRGGGERSVQLEYGWVNLATTRVASTVSTPRAEARVEDESQVVVAFDGEKGRFSAFRGSAQVRSRGGQERTVAAMQSVAQTGDLLSEPVALPAAPEPSDPSDNVELDLDRERRLTLAWSEVANAKGYALQVSRNRLFVDNIIDVRDRGRQQALLGLRAEGTFHWRVAAQIEGGETGPWSESRRFRVTSLRSGGEIDATPPELELETVQSYGNLFIARGVTETGATVRINDEVVVVQADGSFTKTVQLSQQGWGVIEVRATDAWGNEAVRRQRVYVELL